MKDAQQRRIEYRTFLWTPRAERRAAANPYPELEGERVVQGVAAVYDVEIEIWGFREIIAPGAFADSLEGGDILSLYNHDWGSVLGRQSNDSLRLLDQEDGLYTANAFPDTQLGRDTFTLIERGDVKGMSVGMIVLENVWTFDIENEDNDRRRILRADLIEQTFTPLPAYPATSAQVARQYVPVPPRRRAAQRRRQLRWHEARARAAEQIR